MPQFYNPALITAAGMSGLAALLHLACIVGGPSWYRFSVQVSAWPRQQLVARGIRHWQLWGLLSFCLFGPATLYQQQARCLCFHYLRLASSLSRLPICCGDLFCYPLLFSPRAR